MVTIQARDKALQKARIRKGLSLRHLEDLTGITYATLNKVENRRSNPSPGTAAKICKALETDFDTLFLIKEHEEG